MRPWRSWWLGLLMLGALPLCGQDPALEERLNRMEGHIRDLLAAQAEMQKRIGTLIRELDDLREQVRLGTSDRATQADLRRLSEAVQEVDRKRREDYQKIHQEIQALAKALAQPPAPPRSTPRSPEDRPPASRSTARPAGGAPATEVGYEYVVKPGDTLHAIIQAYREQGIPVTLSQVLQANPGLNPNRLQVGQKIFIPAPSQ